MNRRVEITNPEAKAVVEAYMALGMDDKRMVLTKLTNLWRDGKDYPVLRKPYLEVMEKLTGIPAVNWGLSVMCSNARMVTAYVMMQDGYSYTEIGRVLDRSNACISHYAANMANAFAYPKSYKDVMELYNNYITELNNI